MLDSSTWIEHGGEEAVLAEFVADLRQIGAEVDELAFDLMAGHATSLHEHLLAFGGIAFEFHEIGERREFLGTERGGQRQLFRGLIAQAGIRAAAEGERGGGLDGVGQFFLALPLQEGASAFAAEGKRLDDAAAHVVALLGPEGLVQNGHAGPVTDLPERGGELLRRSRIRLREEGHGLARVRSENARGVDGFARIGMRGDVIDEFLLEPGQIQPLHEVDELRFADDRLQQRFQPRIGLRIGRDGVAVEQCGGSESRFVVGFEEDGQSGFGDFLALVVLEELERA